MKSHHIWGSLYIFGVGFLLSTVAVLVLYSQSVPTAKALPLFTPFGGFIFGPPMTNPLPPPAIGLNPPCPVYFTVENIDLTDGLPPVFGVFIPSIPPGISYDYNNLAIPGTPIIGGVEPILCGGGNRAYASLPDVLRCPRRRVLFGRDRGVLAGKNFIDKSKKNMDNVNFSSESLPPQPINWGHFGVIVLAAAALLGMTWLEKPQLFSFHNNQLADVAQVHYVPYVPPASDQPQPAVLGASTNQGPEIIGDDGTVQPVDMGEVLGASTQDVQLSLDSIKVNAIADSDAAIKKYFSDSQAIEGDSVNSTDFAAALNSGDQNQITAQAQKIMGISQALQKLAVPQSLVKLQKLKIIQYNSAADMLQNFTGANSNPDQINNDFQQFLKSQQDLDDENIAVAQKFPQDDPLSSLYLNPDGTPAVSQAAIDNFGSSNSLPAPDAGSNNSDNGNAGE